MLVNKIEVMNLQDKIESRYKTREKVISIIDNVGRFESSLKLFNMDARVKHMTMEEVEKLWKTLGYLVKNITKILRDLKKEPKFAKEIDDIKTSKVLNSFFENTWRYEEKERKSGIKVNDLRMIETQYQGQERLEFFFGFFELYRLGEYISYFNKEDAQKLRDYLDDWIKRV